MWKQFDFECRECGHVARNQLIAVEHGKRAPKSKRLKCDRCQCIATHHRLFPLPARYMGEVDCSPRVHGGRFDTMGYEQGPSLPEMRGEAQAQARMEQAVSKLPAGASERQRFEAMATVEAPDAADYITHMQRPECKEILRERSAVAERNKAKRLRARAKARGDNINFRRDRVSGDPKYT